MSNLSLEFEEKLKNFWIDYAERYCNNKFDKSNLPLTLELFLDSKIKGYRENKTIQSESLSDMSLTYFSDDLSKEEQRLLNSLRKLKVPK